jgi:ribosomal protein L3 glutamine methyltransferase
MTNAADELFSLRDLLRYAVSQFREAEIAFGHGTTNALDEAAYLLLWGLHLPIDQLEPFLDARLTRGERLRLIGLIEERIRTRKPAPYITGEAWIGGHRFKVDERVIVPRSFIGEILTTDRIAALGNLDEVSRVLDLCTGSGCLAILAALAAPNAFVDAVDISKDALEVAAINVAGYGLADRIELLHGDLYGPVAGRTYELIICNPPYVGAAAMAAFPPEFRHEPASAHAGGIDGLDIVRLILIDAGSHLTPEGSLLVEVGTSGPKLATEFPRLPFLWLDTEESEGELFLLSASAIRGIGKSLGKSQGHKRKY